MTAVPALAPHHVRRPRRLLPWASVAWLLVPVLTALGAADDPPCSPADPCGLSWFPYTSLAALLVTVLALALLPEIGVGAAGVASVLLLLDAGVEDGLSVPKVLGTLLPALVATVLLRELDDRRRPAPPALGRWEGPVAPPRVRGRVQVGFGIALLALGALALLATVAVGVDQARREQRASVLTGTVSQVQLDEYGDPSGLVVTVDDRSHDVDTWEADQYRVGDQVQVLVDEDGPFRLAGELFDVAPAAAGCVVLLALGGLLIQRGRLRARGDRPRPDGLLPVWAVRVGPWGHGLAVHAPGAPAAPLALVPGVQAWPAPPLPELDEPGVFPERAYAYGDPSKGGLLHVRTATQVLVPLGPVQ